MNRFNPTIILSLLAIFSLTLVFTSCKKDKVSAAEDAVAAIETVEDDNVAEFNFDSNIDQSFEMAEEKDPNAFATAAPASVSPRLAGNDTQIAPQCVIIEINRRDTFPKIVSINFGSGCRGRDGRLRSGKITIEYSGRMRDSGSVAKTEFDNFYVDSVKVEGVHFLTNISQPGKPKFKREIIDGKLTWPSGQWIQRSAVREVEMLDGMLTITRGDDVFSVTGAANGKNFRGKTWTSKITSALELRGDCRWITQKRFEITKGIVSFQHNSSTGSLDYGNGDCDQKAILTINDRSKEITLR